MSPMMSFADFMTYLAKESDFGFAAFPNVVLIALAAIVLGLLVRRTWLSYFGVFLIFFYYFLDRMEGFV